MDITTLVGMLAIAGLVYAGVWTGELPSTFLNWHGLLIVLGGTAGAMLLNTPVKLIFDALGSLWLLLTGGRYHANSRVVAAVVALAEQVQARGASALQEADAAVAGGYLNRAAQAASEYNKADLVEDILHNEIHQTYDQQNEVVNVFRTMAVIAPMFGLLGTLLGIVQVLKQIADPEQVGPAMGIAVTTAFYGIALANIVCLPVAGKLRIRYYQEMRAKTIVVDGIVMMMRGTVPLVIERKLRSYLS